MLKKSLKDSISKRPKNPYRAPIKSGLFTGNKLVRNYLSEAEVLKTGIFNSRKINFFLKKMERTDAISEIDAMTLSGLLSTQIVYDKFITSFSEKSSPSQSFGLVFDARTNVNL